MTITTKLNVGDSCWILHNNKAVNVKVESVQIELTKEAGPHPVVRIIYSLNRIDEDTGSLISRVEPYVFATKEELLASL